MALRTSPAQVRPLGETATQAPLRGSDRLSRGAVLLGLVGLVVVRLFTEIIPVLPRAGNFIDVPLLAALFIYAVLAPTTPRSTRSGPAPFAIPALMFCALLGISTVVNVGRISALPVLVFLYGFISPIVLYFVVYRVWPVGQAHHVSRTFVALACLQFVIVAFIQLPRFFAEGLNPDFISGTFGENAYQLVFFLLVFGAMLVGMLTFEPRRRASRLAIPLLGASFLVIFLAQYRALLVTLALSTLLVAGLIGRTRQRGLVTATVAIAALLVSFLFVSSRFPVLRFQTALQALRDNPAYLISGRVIALRNVMLLYGENPRYMVTGTGPGTYSSRAWRTFSLLSPYGHADVTDAYVTELTGGKAYRTDVSTRYVESQISSAAILGSAVLASPFASYFALLAEMGLLGFVLIVLLYVFAFLRSARMTVVAMRRAPPNDPLPAILLASTVGFFALLQMGILDNWLEVTRVTFPTWMLFAIGLKEFRARQEAPAHV